MRREYVLVVTTSDNREVVEQIAGKLVGDRLAACVQMLSGIRSVYWWKGKVEKSDEYILFIKTRRDKYKAVENTIRTLHNYEVPEIVCLELCEGYYKYFGWIDEVLE